MILGKVLADYRWANRAGVRDLAKVIGVPFTTLNRVERGENCDAVTLVKILTWLFSGQHPAKRSRLSQEPKP